ncbi:Isoflavone reductase-like protein [Morella rubra]|uniref:Isoflavone reductase-like protein n=1 Tax=Morella rubra TaxID=262757 RepID=A0A6A1W5X4_9ROSI|nr:Isoflavone reductase-like protein [Morella rubra]
MAAKSRILIIGGTGIIGKFIVEASAKAGHPTYVLVRKSTLSNPDKGKLIENFKNLGVAILHGDLDDHESMVNAIKQVDVVISTVGPPQLAEQVKIIAAIKEAGSVKKLGKGQKSPNKLAQMETTAPPRDKVRIFGDGNAKAIFNTEEDIATYTIRAVDDPRTLNKILYLSLPKNIYSFNELVALWEKKIGKPLEKIYVPEEQILKEIKESQFPLNVFLALNHSVFVKGDHTNFAIEPSVAVEASELYPDVKYTTVEEYLHQLRFIPSEFGSDVDHTHVVEPAKSGFDTKVQIRRTVEAEGIPYTSVSCNYFAGYFLPATALSEPGASTAALRDEIIIFGDGNFKGIAEEIPYYSFLQQFSTWKIHYLRLPMSLLLLFGRRRSANPLRKSIFPRTKS